MISESIVRSLFFVFFFAFVWEVHFPGDKSDLGFGAPSVLRGGQPINTSSVFEKLIELWAKKRILEADSSLSLGIRIGTDSN